MTDKSHALAELPLLGSNQDSPDPESVEFGHFAYDAPKFHPRIPPELRRLTHGNPHGLRHKQFVAEVWATVKVAADGCCAYCGKRPRFLHREHMMPKSRGGDDAIENIVPACNRCNTIKGSRTPLEWYLTFDGKRPQLPRRVWPASDAPCWHCAGPCERRRYGKTGSFYDRCGRCRRERVVPRPLGAGQ